MKIKTVLTFNAILLTILLSSCALGQTTTADKPRAWIDAPLNNSQYYVGEDIEIVIHGGDKNGVSAVALSLNGQILVTLPAADPSIPLVTLRHTWQASAPGDYQLSAMAQITNGEWGQVNYANISIIIPPDELPPSPTPSPTLDAPTLVPPTNTPPPTLTPTLNVPSPVPPTNTSAPIVPTTQAAPPADTHPPVINTLTWLPTSPTNDDHITFGVTASDNVGVARIEIYFVIQGQSGGPIQTCYSTTVCNYTATQTFSRGLYTYYAIAYDTAGNYINSFTQTVQVIEVVR